MMRKLKLTKVIVSTLVLASVLTLTPLKVNAEWKQDNKGWWYSDSSSWATGWRNINGAWYYFNSDGYMEHDKTIEGYKLGSDGNCVDNTPKASATKREHEMVDFNQFKDTAYTEFIKGYDGIADFDGIEKQGDWTTTYVEDKSGVKTYLPAMLHECGFTNINCQYVYINDVNDQYKFTCTDSSNNNISFIIYAGPYDYTDSDGCKVYYYSGRLRDLYVNDRIATCGYVNQLVSTGLSKTYMSSKENFYQAGWESRPAHKSLDIYKVRGIRESIGDYKLEKTFDNDGLALLSYKDSNKNQLRLDEVITNYNADKRFNADDVVAYFDNNIANTTAISAVKAHNQTDYFLDDMMKACGYKEMVSKNDGNGTFTYVYSNDQGHVVNITINSYSTNGIYHRNGRAIVEYSMKAPVIDGQVISYKEWQQWLNKGFVYTHATSNLQRELIEQNIINKYGTIGAMNYSLNNIK